MITSQLTSKASNINNGGKKSLVKAMALLSFCFMAPLAQALDVWMGPITVTNAERGRNSSFVFNGQTLAQNIASYNQLTLYFEYYKRGITDTNKSTAYQYIKAQASLTQVGTKAVIVPFKPINIVAGSGNNVVYAVNVNQNFTPNTFGAIPPELLNHGTLHTILNIAIDNYYVAHIPIDFTYMP